MKGRICILGGTGFVGAALAARLSQDGYPLRIVTRHRAGHRDTLVLPNSQLVQAETYDRDALFQAFHGCDTVINLIGILNERGRSGAGFHKAHVEQALLAIQAAHTAGVKRFMHMSALGADEQGPSYYLRTKGEAEKLQAKGAGAKLKFTVFRPSVIFGDGDSFVMRFARLLRWTPLVFPLACANTRMQPVYLGDVVEAFARTIEDPDSDHRTYTLVGPKVYTLREILTYIRDQLGLSRTIIGLPYWLAAIQATLLGLLPSKPFTMDNLRSLSVDSVSDDHGLAELGIHATAMETIVPEMLNGGGHRHDLNTIRRFPSR
jgi:NADH dehydrogenase